MKNSIKPVLLSGGSGTRLWPLSRRSIPKQFLNLFNEDTLINNTIDLALSITNNDFLILGSVEHKYLIKDSIKKISQKCRLILEPSQKNTGPAILAAALNSKPDEILLIMPTDHFIPSSEKFRESIINGLKFAENGSLVVFGVKPTEPNVGYGYIQSEKNNAKVRRVVNFYEKPSIESAKNYLENEDFYWNSGVFLIKASAIIHSFRSLSPKLYQDVTLAVKNQLQDEDCIFISKEEYSKCKSQSFDYEIVEKHKNVFMSEYDGVWSDIGSWDSFWQILSKDKNNNVEIGPCFTKDCKNNLIKGAKRPIVAIGLNDLIIADTSDALLVSSKKSSQNLKEMVELLDGQKIKEASEHKFSSRPWGRFETIDEGKNFKVKRISVNPGASLSLQSHKHRSEHWVVVKGKAMVTRGNENYFLEENQSTYIPIGAIHRLENPSDNMLEIIEIQTGDYLEEDDIKRHTDNYGRL